MKIPIVDEYDNIIYYIERSERKPEEICRTSDLWITDPDGKILLAKRSPNKKDYPGLWGPTVSGVVEEGETYESGIIREIEEEIGLKNIKLTSGNKIKYPNCFSQQFSFILPSGFNDFKIQEEEVAEIKWFTVEELKNKLRMNPEDFLSAVSIKLSSL